MVLLTRGLDYTRPEIAKLLARDGEGELIGWDFVDNDNRPFVKGADTMADVALALAAGAAGSADSSGTYRSGRLGPLARGRGLCGADAGARRDRAVLEQRPGSLGNVRGLRAAPSQSDGHQFRQRTRRERRNRFRRHSDCQTQSWWRTGKVSRAFRVTPWSRGHRPRRRWWPPLPLHSAAASWRSRTTPTARALKAEFVKALADASGDAAHRRLAPRAKAAADSAKATSIASTGSGRYWDRAV